MGGGDFTEVAEKYADSALCEVWQHNAPKSASPQNSCLSRVKKGKFINRREWLSGQVRGFLLALCE